MNCRIFYYAINDYDCCMDLPGIRIWSIFYVVSFIIITSAVFVAAKGVMILVCLLISGLVLGISFFTVYTQVKIQNSREEMQRKLVEGLERAPPDKEESQKSR
jgi:hypothetical protein